MKKHHQVASLAAAIALAMSSTAAMAATPTATQLPGKGKVIVGTAAGTVSTDAAAGTSQLDVAITGNTVIDWGTGTAINKDGVGGFSVGADATVNFTGASGVLNIDSSGNASQIMGAVTAEGNVFVANTNGIIVGEDASITSTAGGIGLIANAIAGYTSTSTYDGNTPDYNGTGGDVTVAAGAGFSGTGMLISGGNVVNVDVASLTDIATISAGAPRNGGAFATTNDSAQINLTGNANLSGAIITSAGDASSAGDITLPVAVAVAGTFTNTGTLNLIDATIFDGALDNENTVTGNVPLIAGSLVNNGDLGVYSVETTDGGITNNAKFVTSNDTTAAGDLVNTGTLTVGRLTTGALTNDGAISVTFTTAITTYGDFLNNGSIANTNEGGTIVVNDGSLTNTGTLTKFSSLVTQSDTEDEGFTAGADYSITNSGQIISPSGFYIDANSSVGTDNDSTGSFVNTGSLSLVSASAGVEAYALNDIDFSGSLMTGSGATAKAVNAKNPIYSVDVAAGDTLTVGTGLYATGNIGLFGSAVNVMADAVAGGMAQVHAGDMVDDGYAVRVAKGVTLGGATVSVAGDDDAAPNVILQGTIEGDTIFFGGLSGQVSDVFTGPEGMVVATGATPTVNLAFTGRIKNAPYTNASNFRYNSLPIAITSDATDALALNLAPVSYQTNGTDNGLSAVNILVNGDVALNQSVAVGTVGINGTAVSGLNDLPNTHLVLQSTGNIEVGANYWPGYVYLGTIDSDADGNALPGTLGFGELSFVGGFSNVLPGNIDGASGMHFMTQFPVGFNGDVITNANAWVNFATDMLTEKYTADNDAAPFIYGGTKSDTSNVVTYGVLDADSINTHPVDASK